MVSFFVPVSKSNKTGEVKSVPSICSRGGQLDQFRGPHFRRKQSARAMKVPDMNCIWNICDNN
jgi:hypothetical protein